MWGYTQLSVYGLLWYDIIMICTQIFKLVFDHFEVVLVMNFWIHLVGKMLIPFTLFTHMPKHISFFIWSLLLDTWSLERGSRYSLMEEDGTTCVLTIRPLDFGDPVYLGQQIRQTYRGPGQSTFYEHTP